MSHCHKRRTVTEDDSPYPPRPPEPLPPDGNGHTPPIRSIRSSAEPDDSHEMNSYCHELTLPLRISPAPSEPYMLRLCIHPDYIPAPDGVVHLARDSAMVSHTSSLHEPALVHIDYELVDLWANSERITSPSSRASSEPPAPEAAPRMALF
ncbi:hypothetical protein ACHAPT_013065 [Fusarium lateritium]